MSPVGGATRATRAFAPDPDGPLQEVWLLESPELASVWDRLDAFEGPGYRRVAVPVLDPQSGAQLGRASVYEALRMEVTGRPPIH